MYKFLLCCVVALVACSDLQQSKTDNPLETTQLIKNGVISVWVNGETIWLNQQSTDARPGVFVARAQRH